MITAQFSSLEQASGNGGFGVAEFEPGKFVEWEISPIEGLFSAHWVEIESDQEFTAEQFSALEEQRAESSFAAEEFEAGKFVEWESGQSQLGEIFSAHWVEWGYDGGGSSYVEALAIIGYGETGPGYQPPSAKWRIH